MVGPLRSLIHGRTIASSFHGPGGVSSARAHEEGLGEWCFEHRLSDSACSVVEGPACAGKRTGSTQMCAAHHKKPQRTLHGALVREE